jgi:hypothetical protein
VAITVAPELRHPLIAGAAKELFHLRLQGGLQKLLRPTSDHSLQEVMGRRHRCGGWQDLILCRHGVASSADPFQRVSP